MPPPARSPTIGRPPLAVSPRRLRPRHPPRYVPPPENPEKKTLNPSPQKTISSDLLNIAKGIKEDLINDDDNDEIRISFTPAGAMFERGRMYDLYSARRNDRLKRKMGEVGDDAESENPAAAVELGKRRSQKKAESLRKSVPADFSVGRIGMMSKEMKKSARPGNGVRASVDSGRRVSTRSSCRV